MLKKLNNMLWIWLADKAADVYDSFKDELESDEY